MSPRFQSYSQNGEDVVLWRALGGIRHGRYIEVGANHPCDDSVSMAFYANGWTGITIEPDPHFAALQREHRPHDILIEAAITARDGDTVTLHVVEGTGLSTLDETIAGMHAHANLEPHDIEVSTRRLDSILREADWAGKDIHFMSVDTEGSERDVLESVDLTVWRPWVLVIEATEPNSTSSTRRNWEHIVLTAGYRFCLFDGLSCFYVSEEHNQQLREALGYSASILDDYVPPALRACEKRVDEAHALAEERNQQVRVLVEEVIRWRGQALTRWATAMSDAARATETQAQQTEAHAQLLAAHEELEALRRRVLELEASTSWRLTAPLRSASGLVGRARGRR
jgi:FkbM family methyltransferase